MTAALIHADRRTHRRDEAKKPLSTTYVNTLKIGRVGEHD